MRAGIRDILIVSTPRDLPMLRLLLGDGSAFGTTLTDAEQTRPEGWSRAFLIGERFLDGGPCAMIPGVNIFHGENPCRAAVATAEAGGATVFAYLVDDPACYGVASFDRASGNAVTIEEKPAAPQSRWALTGLYLCDSTAVEIAYGLAPS